MSCGPGNTVIQSSYIVWVMKLRRMSSVGRAVLMEGEMIYACRVLMGKPDGKRSI